MNRVRSAWSDGRPAIVGWLHIPSSFSAEVLSRCGHDALVVDLQHGAADFTAATEMFRAIESGGVEPFVRLQSADDTGAVMKLLDFGATGVIAPLIETAAQARALVSALHYPPAGVRSYGPRRPLLRHGEAYWETASSTIVSMLMIETALAVRNLEEILAVDGFDGVFIGPADLALSLGCPPSSAQPQPVLTQTIDRILGQAHRAGRKAGIFCATTQAAIEAIGRGFDLVSLPPDMAALAQASSAALGLVKASLAARASGSAG